MSSKMRIYKFIFLLGLTLVSNGIVSTEGAFGSNSALAESGSKVDEEELKFLLSILRDKSLDIEKRKQATISLLKRGWPMAIDELAADLTPGGERSTQHVIAKATGDKLVNPPIVFWRHLVELLGEVDDFMRPDFARALGAYDEQIVRNWVIGLAEGKITTSNDQVKSVKMRKGAILALGHFRSQKTCELLVRLVQTKQDDLRQTASVSLAEMTGIREFNGNRKLWLKWWETKKSLSTESWNKMLLKNFAKQSEQDRSQSEKLQLRLIEVERKLFEQLSDKEKPLRVITLMSDSLTSLRHLGATLTLDLLTKKLEIETEQMNTIKKQIRGLLDDESPRLREVAAKILREPEFINDQTANAVARRLVRQSEFRANILKAYLLLLAEKPKAFAAARGIELMSDIEVRSEAADFISALVAPENAEIYGSLDVTQIEKLLNTIRTAIKQYEENKVQFPQSFVALLGQYGTKNDWKKIRSWLDVNDAVLQEAAARAYLKDKLQAKEPLIELAIRSDSPVIFPIMISAARKDVKDPATFLALVKKEPKESQQVEIWTKAIIEIAGRMPGQDIILADKFLKKRQIDHPLRNDLLSASLTSLTTEMAKLQADETTTEKIKQLKIDLNMIRILRAESFLHLDEFSNAKKDYEQALVSESLSIEQKVFIQAGQVAIDLTAGEMDKALLKSKSVISLASGKAWESTMLQNLAESYMLVARGLVRAKETARAKQLIYQLTTLLEGKLSAKTSQELQAYLK